MPSWWAFVCDSQERYHRPAGVRKTKQLFAPLLGRLLSRHSQLGCLTNVAKMLVENWKVDSDNVKVTDDCIEARYQYANTAIARDENTGAWTVRPTNEEFKLSTSTIVPKLG